MKAWRWLLLVGLCIAHSSWADETFSGYLKNFSLVQFEQTNGDIEIPRQAVQESSLRADVGAKRTQIGALNFITKFKVFWVSGVDG